MVASLQLGMGQAISGAATDVIGNHRAAPDDAAILSKQKQNNSTRSFF
jgi:hypothetical protein